MPDVIIAPTHTYKRGPLRKEIDDTIRDNPDAIRNSQKLNPIIPKGSVKTTGECKTAKMYYDQRPIDTLAQYQRDRAEQIYQNDVLCDTHPMHGISLPVMDATNNVFLKGLSKL
jgi:hypothetical protein